MQAFHLGRDGRSWQARNRELQSGSPQCLLPDGSDAGL